MTELAAVRHVAQQALDGRVRSLLIWSLSLAALTSLQLAAFPAVRSASAGTTELLRSYPPAGPRRRRRPARPTCCSPLP